MTIHKNLNQQILSRELAARSRYERYPITEAQANSILESLFEIWEETLTTPGGKISLSRFGIIEACLRSVGGALKQGSGAAETVQRQACVLQFRPAKRIKAKLKRNTK